MNTTPPGSAWLSRGVLARVAAIAAGLWLLSWLATAALLGDEARSRAQRWEALPQTPWQWDFSRDDAVVWPGSGGFERDAGRTGALSGRVVDGVADLSLALHGERIDPRLARIARLRLVSSAPLRFSLSGETRDGTQLLGHSAAGPGKAVVDLPLAAATPAPLHTLRLRLEAPPGTRVQLDSLQLEASSEAQRADCEAAASVDASLAACHALLPRFVAPALWLPEATLAWRDQVLMRRPAAVVEAPARLPDASGLLRGLRGAVPALLPLLMLLPVAAVALSRSGGSGRPSQHRTALELGLLFVPWVLLLACGLPDADDAGMPYLLLATCLAAALLLRDPTPDWSFAGTRRAWRAAGRLLLWSLAPLALLAAANALDADGFHARGPGRDDLWRYPLWALLQQVVLMRTIGPRMRVLLPDPVAASLASGALFALMHLPNAGLMLASFVAGTAWTWLGFRQRALLPLVLSHALLGLAVVAMAPPWLLRSAEIGGRWLMAP